MKILCIGRNYIEHAEELNNEVPKEPIIFMKPSTAILEGAQLSIPAFTTDLHYELELVLKISKTGSRIPLEEASDYFSEIGLGIDFTARDIQSRCKEKGLPWEKAKAFDGSATLSGFKPIRNYDKESIPFSLKKNGATVQDSHSGLMIFKFDYLVHYCSQYFKLEAGDLLFTGTPKGVGRVQSGDLLEAYLGEELLDKVHIN